MHGHCYYRGRGAELLESATRKDWLSHEDCRAPADGTVDEGERRCFCLPSPAYRPSFPNPNKGACAVPVQSTRRCSLGIKPDLLKSRFVDGIPQPRS